jgi:tetratricopeptide (TPR) repeat protein
MSSSKVILSETVLKKSRPVEKQITSGKVRWIAIAICLFTALLYLHVFNNQLTNWDDDSYIIDNPFIKSLNPGNIVAIFSNKYMGNYHPLSMLCFVIAYKMGGTDAWPYQLMNILLHIGNTALVYYFILNLLKQSGTFSKKHLIVALVASLLFGIHSLQVESVAWVSENKNVLYTFFFLSALILYLKYVVTNQLKFYFLALLLFLLSLFSKGMAVSLSLSLLVIDMFLKRNLLSKKVILEKTPFFILSLVFGIIAISAQGSAVYSPGGGDDFNLMERMSFASYSLIRYLLNLFLPCCLSAFYGYPLHAATVQPIYYLSLVCIITGLLVFVFKGRHNTNILFGILFFLSNIILVLQLLPVGEAMMADRYGYVPSIGYFFIVGNMISELTLGKQKYRNMVILLLTLYIIAISCLTYQRIGIWKSSITLWDDVLKKSERTNNSKAWYGRGCAFNQAGNYEEALRDLSMSIKIEPRNADAFYNRGMVFINRNKFSSALSDLDRAILLKSDLIEAYDARAYVKGIQKDFQGALNDLNMSVDLNPDNPEVYITRGFIKSTMGNFPEAIADYNHAIYLHRENILAYKVRAMAKASMNDYKGAIADYNVILRSNKDPAALYERGCAKIKSELMQEGCKDITLAINLGFSASDTSILRKCGLIISN